MNKGIVIKFKERQIVLGAEFSKKARDVESQEYMALRNVRQDYPDYEIKVRSIRKCPGKESYKGLSYSYMERYISGHDDNTGSIRKKYDEKRLLAECHSIRYPHIKAWFLQTFPEVKNYGVLETSADEAAARTLTETESNSEKEILAAVV